MSDLQPHNAVSITNHTEAIKGFSYYEYKYLVSHQNLDYIKSILDEFMGDTDPFPCGIVDSIYYDNIEETIYSQCLNGEANKFKFRVRGYGEGSYFSLHQKFKELSSVSKYKSKVKMVSAPHEHCPEWTSMAPQKANDPIFEIIMHNARSMGHLYPSVRVQYFRYRYRAYDYRMTLDTNIEVYTPVNGLPRPVSYAVLPYHVLEIKTTQTRPKLPFVGLIKLPQVSFSKFMLGLQLLKS